MRNLLRRSCRPCVLVLLLAVPGAAQLDLPGKGNKPAKGGEIVTPREPKRARGLQLPSGDVDGAVEPAAGATPQPLVVPTPAPREPERASYDSTPGGAARYIFDQLDGEEDPDSTLARGAISSLGALGSEALGASRQALWERDTVGLVTAARVLVRFGAADDRRAVTQRLEDRVPTRAAGPLLATVLAADPVLVTPEYLIGLLDHPTTAMRTAAQRTLVDRVDASYLTLLAVHLSARRAHTRELALDLIAGVEDPSVRLLIASRLGDSSSRVALRAAELLAQLDDEAVATMLLQDVFGPGGFNRERAYGLLALIQREDRRRERLLGEEHVGPLLVALRNPDTEIVSGAAAAALAGLGFRSTAGADSAWLDRDVPHTLVRLASGAVFHPDFSALQPTALSRLGLITGQNFGRNGPAWQTWWSENADGFRARRAFLNVRPEEASLLRVTYTPELGRESSWSLVGAGRGADPAGDRAIYLTPTQCDRLLAVLQRSGVLGSERIPLELADSGVSGRGLEVEIRDQRKRFELAFGATAPWFDEIESFVLDLVQENRWQGFHVPEVSRHDFWLSESSWWEGEASATARGRRLKGHLLARLAATPTRERGADLAELTQIYAQAEVPEPVDFAALLDLLDDEEFFAGRTRSLLDLALICAATTGSPPRPGGATIEPELGRALVDLLAARFHENVRAEAQEVLVASGRDVVRELATAPQSFQRSLAPHGLVRDPEAQDLELLLALLEDPIEEVEVATLQALGEGRVAAARDPIFQRARAGSPAVRAAALRAAGLLGGDEVMNLCILGLAEREQLGVQKAAALALADLADPESAGLLAGLFARGPESHFFEPAREGLRRLGPAAWPELLRQTAAGAQATRREAALLLAEQGVPQACSTLLSLLTQDPDDERIAWELAVLTCVDFREDEGPALAWWSWWDLVVHDDSLAWLRAAAVREGLEAPPEDALQSEGTREGALFLYTMMQLEGPHLVERARRELERLLGVPVETPPTSGQLRGEWLAAVQQEIDESY